MQNANALAGKLL